MKKCILASLAVVSTFSCPTMSNAAESSWYLGTRFGQSQVKEDLQDFTVAVADSMIFQLTLSGIDATIHSVSSEDTDTAGGLTLGYQFSPNFSIEAGYLRLGEYSAAIVGTAIDGLNSADVSVSATAEVDGFFGSLIAAVPLSEELDLFGKVGIYRYTVDSTLTGFASTDFNSTTEMLSGSVSDQQLSVGIGAKYRVDQWAFRLEFERFQGLSADEDLNLDSDVNLLSLGVQYHF